MPYFPKKNVRPFLLLTLLCNLAMAQPYRWVQPLKQVRADGYFQVGLTPEVLARLRPGFADLRLVEISGTDTIEVPYLIHSWPDDSVWKPVDFEVINEGERRSEGFFSLKLNENQVFNRIRLTVDADAYDLNFSLETSKNRLFWEPFASRKLSGKLQGGKRAGKTTLDTDSLRTPFLRIQYQPAEIPVEVEAVGYYQFLPGKYRKYEVADWGETEDPADNTTTATFDLGQRLPVSRLRIRAGGSRDYFRQSTLFVAEDTTLTNWKKVKDFALSSLSAADLEIPLTWGRHWKVVVQHEDNLPVRISRIDPFAPAFSLIADMRRGISYALLYGSDRGRAPRYDLPALTEGMNWDQLPEIGLEAPVYIGLEETADEQGVANEMQSLFGGGSPWMTYGLYGGGGILVLLLLWLLFRKKKPKS
jgi:hypothetical protein